MAKFFQKLEITRKRL